MGLLIQERLSEIDIHHNGERKKKKGTGTTNLKLLYAERRLLEGNHSLIKSESTDALADSFSVVSQSFI